MFAERLALGLVAFGLLFVLGFHLVPGLIAGMLIYSLLRRIDVSLRRHRLSSGRHARLIALACLGIAGALIAGAGSAAFFVAWRARASSVPELLSRMAQILEGVRHQLGNRWIPEQFTDVETIGEAVAALMRDHAQALQAAGSHAGRLVAHLLAGAMIGLLASFHHRDPEDPKPLAAALAERLRRLLAAFEAVVFAQARISALNTALSAVYLFLILPLFGVQLPLRPTLVAVTFAAGLLPVIGNLLSNTAIVLISLSVSPKVAAASLLYLVLIHKLEYLVNAKIVGERIKSQAWEVLLSMVLMEVAFGLPGLVMAPVFYAYAKGELQARDLV